MGTRGFHNFDSADPADWERWDEESIRAHEEYYRACDRGRRMVDLERLEARFLAAKLREYDGTLFWFCARNDRERIAMFRRAAQAVGRQGRDGRAVCTAMEAEKSAERCATNAFFVTPGMKCWLEQYLNACPPGARHLLVYSRRNNGPSPIISDFMDLWWGKRNIEVWELGAPWWLLDVEASGLDREKDSIIALRLARMEQLESGKKSKCCARDLPQAHLSFHTVSYPYFCTSDSFVQYLFFKQALVCTMFSGLFDIRRKSVRCR